MGFGDELMVTGQARQLYSAVQKPVLVQDRNGAPRWHDLWRDNPIIMQPKDYLAGADVQFLQNGPGLRPYVDYERMKKEFAALFPGRAFTTKVRHTRLPWRYTEWRAPVPELYLTTVGGPQYIVVEPNIKAGTSPNKQWGWERWQALVDEVRFDKYPWVQLGPPRTRLLKNVRLIETRTFEAAILAMAKAVAAVLPEGGLHHVAAALGVPAVVIYGGMTYARNTGYDLHTNVVYEHQKTPCGMRVPCRHCREAMAGISVHSIAQKINDVVAGRV